MRRSSATRGRAPPNAMPEAEAETATETLFGDARTCACFVTRRRIHVCGGQRTQQAHASNHSIVIGMCPALRRTDIGVVMEQARYSGDATAVCDGDQHTTSDVAAWWCLGSNQRHAHSRNEHLRHGPLTRLNCIYYYDFNAFYYYRLYYIYWFN